MRTLETIIVATLLALLCTEAPAQILWKPTTNDVWGYNPETGEADSNLYFSALDCSGDNCTAAGIFDDTRLGIRKLALYRSNDGGKSWFEQPQSVSYKPQVANWAFRKVQQIDSLNAVVMAYLYGVIIRTTDGGATWFTINSPVESELWDIHFSDPMTGIVVCSGDSILFTTTDGGITWNYRLSTGTTSCRSHGGGKFSFLKYAHGPIYTVYDNDFTSLDSSKPLFDSITDPLGRYVVSKIDFGENGLLFGMGSYYTVDSVSGNWNPNGLIIRSTDNGETWEEPHTFPWQKLKYIRHITPTDRDTLYAGGGDWRFHIFSSDRGRSWRLDSNLIDGDHETALCFGLDMAADGHPIGAFGHPFHYASVLVRGEYPPAKVEYTEMIKYYTYFYPNPTSGIVNIDSRYSLPATVIDMLGREVVREKKLSADGKLTLDLSYLSPGIYNVVFDWMGRKFIAGKVVVVE